ncbi:adenylate/guanylate cyclase domain-containing protein [Nocardioides pacificus]
MGPEPPITREQLERAILRDTPAYDSTQVSKRAGVPLDVAKRLWRSLGFPENEGEVIFTEGDLEALSTLNNAVNDGLLDFPTAVNLTRAVGQTMARLADWEVGTLLARVDELESSDEATGSRLGSALRLVQEFNTPFEQLMVYAWRRHLAASVARIEALGSEEDDLHTVQVTVGFADIVAFTALSNDIGESRIGDMVEIFESRCHDVVATHRGRVIKSIGDSVLFVANEPIQAIDIAEGIISVIGRDPRMPDVRVGLATGSVVMRLGDVFGPPVNMAARLTGVARRNRVIVDAATAALLPEEDFDTRRLPARPVRGFGLVEPVAVRRH